MVGRSFWAARQGRDALVVDWDLSAAESRSSAALMAEYKALAQQPGLPARQDGDADRALAGAAR
ncbi:hypothetical protein ACSTJG_25385, partial [Vibrio parahaemolyticus]